jgi:hypothetical protein
LVLVTWNEKAMMRSVVRVLLGVSLVTQVALAEDDVEEAHESIEEEAKHIGEKAGVRPEVLGGGAYGSAGCGLGSLIFEPSESFMQVFAATTNGSFGTQTFGITSGTSNCDGAPHSASAVNNFIVANRAALTVDVARGGGETIRSLSALAQCRDDAALGSTLQRNFSGIFPSAQVSDREVSQSMVRVMSAHDELGCRVVG